MKNFTYALYTGNENTETCLTFEMFVKRHIDIYGVNGSGVHDYVEGEYKQHENGNITVDIDECSIAIAAPMEA